MRTGPRIGMFFFAALVSGNVSAADLSITAFGNEDGNSGYAILGFEAVRSFGIALRYLEDHSTRSVKFAQVIYRVKNDKIMIEFLSSELGLDSDRGVTVTLDRKSLTVVE